MKLILTTNKQKGFTLIELLIVVAIIGILAAVGTAVIPGLLENTKKTVCITNHKTIEKTIRTEYAKCQFTDKLTLMAQPSNYKQGKEYDLGCTLNGNPRSFASIAEEVAKHTTNFIKDAFDQNLPYYYRLLTFKGCVSDLGSTTIYMFNNDPNKVRLCTRCSDSEPHIDSILSGF